MTITHRPDLTTLIVRWLAPTTDDELRRDYAAIEAAALAHDQCRNWLFDIRRRATADDSFNAWVSQHFYPLLPAKLGGPVRVAFLSTPMQLAQVILGTSQTVVAEAAKTGTHIRFFADEGPALAWLMQ